MRRWSCFILICFLIPCNAFAQIAQKSYLEGYFITNSQDTIRGLIRQEKIYSGKLKYKKSNHSPVKKVKIKELKAMKVGNQLYRNIDVNLPEMFKTIVQGPVSLYERPLPEMHSDPNLMPQYPASEFWLKKNDFAFKIRKEGFHKELSQFFSDYQELSKKIAEKIFQFDDLVEIVTDYNYWYNYKRFQDKP